MENTLTVLEATAMKHAMEQKIADAIHEFERATELTVEDVALSHATHVDQTTVVVVVDTRVRFGM